MDYSRQYQVALSRWDNEGGAVSVASVALESGDLLPELHPLTTAELVLLRVRVIALENLLIPLLAAGADRQLDLACNMAGQISPRPDFPQHPLTIRAATQMVDLVERGRRVRRGEPP